MECFDSWCLVEGIVYIKWDIPIEHCALTHQDTKNHGEDPSLTNLSQKQRGILFSDMAQSKNITKITWDCVESTLCLSMNLVLHSSDTTRSPSSFAA